MSIKQTKKGGKANQFQNSKGYKLIFCTIFKIADNTLMLLKYFTSTHTHSGLIKTHHEFVKEKLTSAIVLNGSVPFSVPSDSPCYSKTNSLNIYQNVPKCKHDTWGVRNLK